MTTKATDRDSETCREALEVCPCLHVRRAARAVTRLFDDLLQPVGVRSTQFVLLASLRAEGEMRLPRLAEELSLDRSALTRALRPLEANGLVRRVPGRTGRASRAALTAKGRGVVHKAIPLWREGLEQLLSGTSESRYRKMIAELDAITKAATAV